MGVEVVLTPVDYVVAVIILLVPVAIGVLFAVRDADKSTRTEYLLGGRQMSILPVALSMFVTFQSAISIIGNPSEIFYYGSIYILFAGGQSLSYVIGYYTIVPLMYPLQITSIYEYLQYRYDSELVRIVSTVLGMLQTTCYMAIALFSPALALESSAGIPLWMSIAVIGVVGAIYTAIGGIKSVIWTDAFQTFIIYVGLLGIIIKACVEVGGLDEVWHLSKLGNRFNFNKFSPDIRVRHTVWSLHIAMCFMWLVNSFNQPTLQRICCTKNLKEAKVAYLLNIPLIIVYSIFLWLVGLAVYAYFAFNKCEPYQAGLIGNRNQLLPFFVLHAMRDLPGMAGLFISVLCCGSLSTLSSGINALATNTVEDILRRPLRGLREATITLITKFIVIVYGAGIIGLAYLAAFLEGPVTEMAISSLGAFGSPLLGIFLLGGSVPWANKFGALAGGVVSLVFNLWISIGSRLQGLDIKLLPSPGTQGCNHWLGLGNSTDWVVLTDPEVTLNSTIRSDMSAGGVNSSTSTSGCKPAVHSGGFFLFDISYEWYCLLGTLVCVVTGLVVSYVTNKTRGRSTDGHCADGRYIFPFMRRLWKLGEMSLLTDDILSLNKNDYGTKSIK